MKLGTLARAALGISAICLVLLFLDKEEIIKNAHQISLLNLVLAVLLNICAFYIYAVRWFILIRVPKGNYNSSFGKYFLGNYFNFFTPANLGGDIYRASAFTRPDLKTSQLIMFLVFERVAALIVFLLFLLIASVSLDLEITTANIVEYLVRGNKIWWVITLISILTLIAVSIFSFKKVTAVRVSRWVNDLMSHFTLQEVSVFLALTTAGMAFCVGGFHLISSSLDFDVPYAAWLIAFISAELSRWIPVSIQGIGIREATFASVGAAVMGHPELFFLVGGAGYVAMSLAVSVSIVQAHIHNQLSK